MYIIIVCKINNNNKDIILNIDKYNNYLSSIDDFDFCKLVYRYQKVFCDSLLKILPSKWNIKYAIKINNAKPININAYLLFKTHIDKQVK